MMQSWTIGALVLWVVVTGLFFAVVSGARASDGETRYVQIPEDRPPVVVEKSRTFRPYADLGAVVSGQGDAGGGFLLGLMLPTLGEGLYASSVGLETAASFLNDGSANWHSGLRYVFFPEWLSQKTAGILSVFAVAGMGLEADTTSSSSTTRRVCTEVKEWPTWRKESGCSLVRVEGEGGSVDFSGAVGGGVGVHLIDGVTLGVKAQWLSVRDDALVSIGIGGSW